MKTRVLSTITLGATLALTLSLAFAPLGAHAESPEGAAGEGSFSTAFASRYVWRGQILSKGLSRSPPSGSPSAGSAPTSGATSIWTVAKWTTTASP